MGRLLWQSQVADEKKVFTGPTLFIMAVLPSALRNSDAMVRDGAIHAQCAYSSATHSSDIIIYFGPIDHT